ncbi:sensor domain-containing diguanylate cyclase [Massilia sp. B-10]|nr:sensor domain-containing diguanylate cyclase [Massilia sp. B-10]
MAGRLGVLPLRQRLSIVAIFGTNPPLAAMDAAHAEVVIHPDDIALYRATLAASAESLERWHLQFRVILPGAGLRWREGEARPRRLDDGSTVWHGFIADISAHKELEHQLKDAAATDFLTGLPNRRHIMARMDQELARVQRDPLALSAVLMFDLDLFKDINDTHGHAKGDAVLRHFAQVLLCELRKVDSVGRIGGEEFAILLSGADVEDAALFAERARTAAGFAPVRGRHLHRGHGQHRRGHHAGRRRQRQQRPVARRPGPVPRQAARPATGSKIA